jgi:type 2 lantibiotic biosynthesis protein LanM
MGSMASPQLSQPGAGQPQAPVVERMRLEGWSLNTRLRQAPDEASSDASLEHWRTVVAPDQHANFSKRLQWDGRSPAQAAWALAPDPEQVPMHPGWWPTLEHLRTAATTAAVETGLEQRGADLPFVHAWRPATSWALRALQERCADLAPQLQLRGGAWLDLAEALLERVCTITDQALWELFNQRRTPGQMLLAHLGVNGDGSGEPVHEAYDALVSELLTSGYGLVLADYPVLGRLLAEVTDLWLEGSEEMLRRLADSRTQLVDVFAIAADAPLESIQLGLSDPHRGGRAVAILHFGEGEEVHRVVYKPKDMQVDLVYQQVLQELNRGSSLPPLRHLSVLSCPGYGFMEWVEHRLCTSDAELAAFYTNAGRTMAVLHLLGCTDCHYENLIASGDQMVLIDTETLLEADLRDLISDDGDDPDALSPLQNSMQGSVLRSGLLPQWLMAGAGRKRAFDVSALGIQPPPPERDQPGWLGLNSDGMMAGRSTQPCELPTSLPVGLGSPQRLTEFVEELCNGFEAQMLEVIRLRPQLQEALEGFRGKPRRLVARATRLYFTIQRQMLEPAALRSAVAQGLKLEQLSRSFVLASEKPLNWPMFEAEVRQMERLDIPFFEHLIDGEELPLPEGLAPIEAFMKSSGLAAAHRRLKELDSAEISFQQQLVRGAIAARHMATIASPADRDQAAATVEVEQFTQPLGANVYGKEALKLGEQLWEAAISDRKGRPEWLGMDLGTDGESFHFGLIGPSLYSGVSGIALAMARIGQAQPMAIRTAWLQRAWSCLEGLAQVAERNSNDQLFRLMRDLPYGLSGSGGLLLALGLLQEVGLEEAGALANQLVDQLRPKRLLADDGIDIIAGVAGLIGPLLRCNSPRSLDLASVCGERLLALQLETGGWSMVSRNPALTGFSHGAAGMAAALARFAKASGEVRFMEAAQRAVAYERSVFVAEQRNWPDFRSNSEPTDFMLSWCHGAPGILLSRLVLQEAGAADEHTAAEIEAARDSTIGSLERITALGSEAAGHLCCGVFGLTTLLRLDAAQSGLQLAPQVIAAEQALIHAAQEKGDYRFFSVDNGSLNLPGLFTGKAGVALALQEASDNLRWLGPVLSAGLLR